MEHTPSGTDDGQYWYPQGQQPDGYPPAEYQQQPVQYPQSAEYQQQGYYPPNDYQHQPPYQDQSQQQYYAPASYPEGQQQYQPYPADPYASSQGYYQPQEYAPTEQWTAPPAYQQDSYQQDPYQQDVYQQTAEYAATPAAPYAQQLPDAEPEPLAHEAHEPVPEPTTEPEPSEPPVADPGSGPLAGRLVAAATGRTPGTNRRTFLIRAAVGGVALLVVAGAGYAVAGKGAAAKPAAGAHGANLAGTHTKTWSATADTAAKGGNDGLLGAWILASALVRGDGTGVTAYDPASGHTLWSVAAPAAGAVPCAMSPTVNAAGLGAVLFQAKPGNGQACTQLVVVDTASGTAKWSAKIAAATAAYGASVMVNDTRAVAVGDLAAVGYDITNGKQSWSYAGPGKFCGALNGNGNDGALLLESTCADTTPKAQAISLDPASGKLIWWRGLPLTAASYTVLSASPAVVAVHMADPTKDSILSFTAKGDSQASINVSQTAGMLDSTHGAFDPDPALFFQDNTMIAEIVPTGSGSTSAAAGLLTAFALADGKQLWQATPTEKGRSALVGIDGTAAVVATEERVGQQAKLSHFDLATGKEVPGGNFPTGTGSLLTSGRVLYKDSLVAVLPEFTSTYGTSLTAYTATG